MFLCVCMTVNVYHRRLMYFLDFVKKILILCFVVMEDSSLLVIFSELIHFYHRLTTRTCTPTDD